MSSIFLSPCILHIQYWQVSWENFWVSCKWRQPFAKRCRTWPSIVKSSASSHLPVFFLFSLSAFDNWNKGKNYKAPRTLDSFRKLGVFNFILAPPKFLFPLQPEYSNSSILLLFPSAGNAPPSLPPVQEAYILVVLASTWNIKGLYFLLSSCILFVNVFLKPWKILTTLESTTGHNRIVSWIRIFGSWWECTIRC